MRRFKRKIKKEKISGALRNSIKEVNRRLRDLKKSGYYGTWSSKRLVYYLKNAKVLGRNKLIDINKLKERDEATIILLKKSIDDFLKSKLSNSSTIKRREEEIRQTTLEQLSSMDSSRDYESIFDDVTPNIYEKLNIINDLQKSNDFWDLGAYIGGPTDLIAILDETITNGYDEDDFMRSLSNVIDIYQDEDIYNAAVRIYGELKI